MIRRVLVTACAVVLLAGSVVSAQQVVTGTVVRIDQPSGVVVLDNGQMYQATPQTVFLVNNQPTSFATMAPGTPVVVQHGQPVMLRDGRYVVVSQGTPVVTQPAPVVMQPAPVIVGQAPAPLPVSNAFETSGVVKYVDSVRRIVRFEDGRNLSVDESVQLLANGSPVLLTTLRPGTFVVARSAKPLAFRDNTHYSTAAPAGTIVAPAGTVVAPAGTVVGAPGAPMYSGTVVRIDQPNTIVLNDGRVIPATAQTVVMVDNRPVPLTALQPGAQVVVYPNGQTGVAYPSTAYPSAFPAAVPEAGLREQATERNAP